MSHRMRRPDRHHARDCPVSASAQRRQRGVLKGHCLHAESFNYLLACGAVLDGSISVHGDTAIALGGFYGWPWWYIGAHQDPRHACKRPELRERAIIPDVLLQPHNASLQITFYEGARFPREYFGDIFAAEHGSWNKSVRVGYEVIRVPLHQTGKASGEYEDFLTGFVLPNGQVWGRPVGVTTAADGALLVTDDGSNSIWRIDYLGSTMPENSQIAGGRVSRSTTSARYRLTR